ncbi:hypothetical protein SAMN04487926_16314 [Paraburkholderia steynii]|uniref:Post-SET domain-containing protein n=2 Tax=Paraburkholderia steynii TaxID=1245441 RepID=A0A7Z7BM38_9BURK|nr:hypothetical protein SAMN04487926_16314 [Paraburkholderia steynii]
MNRECVLNCEATEPGSSVFIHALTAIHPGEELFIDYSLVADGEITDDICTQYACHCGSALCRHSMLTEATAGWLLISIRVRDCPLRSTVVRPDRQRKGGCRRLTIRRAEPRAQAEAASKSLTSSPSMGIKST